jgi:hypothetical protein
MCEVGLRDKVFGDEIVMRRLFASISMMRLGS